MMTSPEWGRDNKHLFNLLFYHQTGSLFCWRNTLGRGLLFKVRILAPLTSIEATFLVVGLFSPISTMCPSLFAFTTSIKGNYTFEGSLWTRETNGNSCSTNFTSLLKPKRLLFLNQTISIPFVHLNIQKTHSCIFYLQIYHHSYLFLCA